MGVGELQVWDSGFQAVCWKDVAHGLGFRVLLRRLPVKI